LALASRMRPRPLVLGVVVGDDGDEVDRETGQLRDDPLRAALVRRTLYSLGGLDHYRIPIKVTGILNPFPFSNQGVNPTKLRFA
jgi:hypothetical protein